MAHFGQSFWRLWRPSPSDKVVKDRERNTSRDVRAYKVPYYVEKYRTIRHQPDDLFDSERYFLPRCLRPGMRVLDIGCACGGFFNILRSFEPTIEYKGIDVSEVLVAEARRIYSEGQFEVVDATTLPYPDGSFDLVQAWGVILHEPEYRKLIQEAWRVTRNAFLLDVRLQPRGREVVDKTQSFVLNPGGIRNYYIVPNGVEFFQSLLKLDPVPARIDTYGYEGRANEYTTLPEGATPLYLAACGIFKKHRRTGVTVVRLELPEAFSTDLVRRLRKSDVQFEQ